MAKRKKKGASSEPLEALGEAGVIEGVVEHVCGWVSDGGAFREGAGCPKCGERIRASDCEEVTTGELVHE